MVDFRRSMSFRRAASLGRCSRLDVAVAFRAVHQELRLKLDRCESSTLTLAEAAELAKRIKEQRELVRQINDRRNDRHVRRLLKLNRRHRDRLLALARQAGLDTAVLICR